MSLGNDHYYGHVDRFIVENKVTWLELATCSPIWTTLMVYHIDGSYGHTMNETLGCASGRTGIKGNLFSYPLAMEDMARSVTEAMTQSGGMPPDVRELAEASRGIPHSEDVLALLVHVKVFNGSADLAQHVKGLTLRLHVLEKLCDIMRHSGYPGYGAGDVNSAERVAHRLKKQYKDPYGEYGRTAFVPDKVYKAVECVEKKGVYHDGRESCHTGRWCARPDEFLQCEAAVVSHGRAEL